MKKFTETYKIENKVSLEGFEEQIQEKLKNIDGQNINECCCCSDYCGDCCKSDCSTQLCSDPPCSDLKLSSFRIKYNSNTEIVNKLKTDVKVSDLYDIVSQFNMTSYRSASVKDILDNSPLYFYENTMCSTACPMMLNSSTKIEQFVKSLCKKHGFKAPIILGFADGTTSLFCVKHTGTNGKEASIKNSLLEIYEILNLLEENEEISNASCVDISIDNIDDVYAFLVRISLDKIFIINSLKQ